MASNDWVEWDVGPGDEDLVSLDLVKSYLNIKVANTDDDSTIQQCITEFSIFVLNRTGIDSFTHIHRYTEFADGNGFWRLFPRNRPITKVYSISTLNYVFPQSTDLAVAGWFIENGSKSIAFRSVGSPNALQRFPAGVGNIKMDYEAGYSVVPQDLQGAAMRAVAQNYRRKDWVDLSSRSLSSGSSVSGTTKYRDWALPPEVDRIIDQYSRYATR